MINDQSKWSMTNSLGKNVNSKNSTPLTRLDYQAKQVLTVMSKYQEISINTIQVPSEIPPSRCST